MSERLKRASQLSWAEWRQLGRAVFWLSMTDLCLRFLSYQRVDALIRPDSTPGRAVDSSDERIRQTVWGVDAASRYFFYPINCLPKALVLRRMLAQQGLSTELQIGVRVDGGQLEAHAWVEHQGRPLGAGPHHLYQKLDRVKSI